MGRHGHLHLLHGTRHYLVCERHRHNVRLGARLHEERCGLRGCRGLLGAFDYILGTTRAAVLGRKVTHAASHVTRAAVEIVPHRVRLIAALADTTPRLLLVLEAGAASIHSTEVRRNGHASCVRREIGTAA